MSPSPMASPLDLARRTSLSPGLGALELSAQTKERGFIAEARRELYADRQARPGPGQGHGHRRAPRRVEERGEPDRAEDRLRVSLDVVGHQVEDAERVGRPAHGRREQQVIAREEPRDDSTDAMHDADRP